MRNSLRIHAASALLLTAFLWAGSPPEAPVADAAMRGDLDAVKELLSRGADVNAAQGDGMTALHWAADMGNSELARTLLAAGASVESVTRLGDYTPLHMAAKSGHPEVARLLLDAGADVEAVTSTGGARALHFAAQTAHPELVDLLLEYGADVNAREGFWGQTALMFAASAGRADVVRQLLEAGADPSLRSKVLDVEARAELDNAAGDIRQEVLEGFRGDRVAGGEGWLPSPDEVQAAVTAARNVPVDAVDDPKLAGLEHPGLPHLVDTGSTKGAEGEAPSAPGGEAVGANAEAYNSGYAALVGGQGGLTALLHAVREGNVEATMALLDAGADINQPSGGDHTSPLLMATINGHFDLALQLLGRGADPNVVSDAGAGPLFAVINTEWAPKARYPQQQAYLQQKATHLDVMKALLEAGADPNQRLTKHIWYMEYTFSHLGLDMRGATPFFRAAHGLDVPAMKLLVEYGADPNIPTMKAPERRRRGGGDQADPSGLPPVPAGGPAVYPIHAATGHGYGTGYAGNSHRHVANGWLPAVRYLVEEVGADVNARDENGYSPLHNAASRGDVEVIQYLLEHGADPMVVSREGQTAVDMANGPQQRIQPFPDAIRLLEAIGVPNNHRCVSC